MVVCWDGGVLSFLFVLFGVTWWSPAGVVSTWLSACVVLFFVPSSVFTFLSCLLSCVECGIQLPPLLIIIAI